MYGDINMPDINMVLFTYIHVDLYTYTYIMFTQIYIFTEIHVYVLWPPCAKETLAGMWLDDMPDAAVTIVRNKRLASGATLVKLDCDITRPTSRESQLGFGIVVLTLLGVSWGLRFAKG